MVDQQVQGLLEQVVNSPTKLQLLLLFAENPGMSGNASQVANRVFHDIWSISDALSDLHDQGILSASEATEPCYCYAPKAEYQDTIRRLLISFNEPLERDQLQQYVREVARYTGSGSQAFEFEFI